MKKNVDVRNKRLKHNMPSSMQQMLCKKATIKRTKNMKHSGVNVKWKPSTKNNDTGCEDLANALKHITSSPMMTKPQGNNNINSTTTMMHLLQNKGIAKTITMKNKASASSSSPCLSFPEAMIRKTYLLWALKVDKIFRLHNFEEEKKIAMASLEFQDYVLIWWEQVIV